jgi:HlyD family secretion protein
MAEKSHRVRAGAVVFVLAVVGVAAAVGYLLLRGAEVEVVSPVRGDVSQTVVSSGRVLPPAEINIGALVNSTVREVFVKEGDIVSAGQVLIQLDDNEVVAGLAQAKAALERAQAGRYEIAKLNGPEAGANLRRAEASYAAAQKKLKTTEALLQAGAASRGEVDDARTALSVAQAQREAAQLQLKATTASGSRSVLAAAGVAQAKADMTLAEVLVSRTRIVSPVDGIVLSRYLEPGDAVVAGTKMLQLSRTGDTRLVIEPDERNLALFIVGQEATASAEAFPKERFDAVLQTIAPAVDPQRGTVEVRLLVAAPPAYLRPHMTVSVEVEVGRREGVLLLNRGAIRDLASPAPFVMVVVSGRAARQNVELGIIGDNNVEVLSGIDEGARVIDGALGDIAAGDRVRVRGS